MTPPHLRRSRSVQLVCLRQRQNPSLKVAVDPRENKVMRGLSASLLKWLLPASLAAAALTLSVAVARPNGVPTFAVSNPKANTVEARLGERPFGYGSNAYGGEGGKTCIVTTAEDTKGGRQTSLRDCLEADGPRIVTFAPGLGQIALNEAAHRPGSGRAAV